MVHFAWRSLVLLTLFGTVTGYCDGNDPWENLPFIQVRAERQPGIDLNVKFRGNPRAFARIPISTFAGIHFLGSGGYGTEAVLSTIGEHDFHIILTRLGTLETFTFERGTREIFEPAHPAITKTVRIDL